MQFERNETMNIAFLGLGAMGQRMARRLVDAKHTLTVYNRTHDRAEAFAKESGATAARTPKDAVANAEIVIAMVTDDDASRDLWLHPEHGAAAALPEGAIAIESSTLTPAWIAELATHLDVFLDAPVAGSRPQAEAGQLIYLVGGSASVVDRVRPLLEVMGGAVRHVGELGAGASMKLAVNTLFAVQVATLGEVVGMLEHSGMDRQKALDALAGMPITAPALKGVAGLMATRSYGPLFPIHLVEKDLRYASKTASALGTCAPLASAARDVYESAKQKGFGGDNIHGVAKLFERPERLP